MSRFHSLLLPCLVIGGAIFLLARPAAAQDFDDVGIVRVSDSSPDTIKPMPEGMATTKTPCPQGNYCPNGVECQNCRHGWCPFGHCQTGNSGYCIQDCACTRHVAQVLDWFNPCGMYTYSPDHGWAPPVKRPIYRMPVSYQKGFPDSWMGVQTAGPAGPRAPTVYMPTDTTQLGYYYQAVPYWQPRFGTVPPPPRPSDWHVSLAQTQFTGHPAGVILGTAPVAQPLPLPLPTPVLDQQGLPPTPVREVEPIPGAAPNTVLEKSAGNPSLLPIR